VECEGRKKKKMDISFGFSKKGMTEAIERE
jgi:hypothetical protein